MEAHPPSPVFQLLQDILRSERLPCQISWVAPLIRRQLPDNPPVMVFYPLLCDETLLGTGSQQPGMELGRPHQRRGIRASDLRFELQRKFLNTGLTSRSPFPGFKKLLWDD